MCTYNGARFLPEQLESLATQERPPDEIVVCDDRSTDETTTMLRCFSQRSPFPVRLFENEKHLGSTKSFEKAMSLCSGEIIVLADQDDIWYPRKLRSIEQLFGSFTAPVLAFSDAELIDGNSRPLNSRLWNAVGFTPREQRRCSAGDGFQVMVKHPTVTGATMAFRRDSFDVLSPFPSDIIHDRWMSLILAAVGPIEIIRNPLMKYRKHRDQQIGTRPTFQQRLQRAGLAGEQLYLDEISFFHRLQDHLEKLLGRMPRVANAISEIARKISHLERRVLLHRRDIPRVPMVVREVCNRGYWRYSAGWESVAKDLFLPTHL